MESTDKIHLCDLSMTVTAHLYKTHACSTFCKERQARIS